MGKPGLSSDKEAREGTGCPVPCRRARATLSTSHDSEHRSQGKAEGRESLVSGRWRGKVHVALEQRPAQDPVQSQGCAPAQRKQPTVTRKSVPMMREEKAG